MPWTSEQRKRYGPRWKAISKNIRFRRAHGRCENCGAKHGQRFLFSKGEVRLSACHRNHTPGDNRATNLAAWCQACHLNYDRADNVQRRARTWQLHRAEILFRMAERRLAERLRQQPCLFQFDFTKEKHQ